MLAGRSRSCTIGADMPRCDPELPPGADFYPSDLLAQCSATSRPASGPRGRGRAGWNGTSYLPFDRVSCVAPYARLRAGAVRTAHDSAPQQRRELVEPIIFPSSLANTALYDRSRPFRIHCNALLVYSHYASDWGTTPAAPLAARGLGVRWLRSPLPMAQ